MHTQQQTKKVSGLYENITQGVLNDFALHFNTPSKKEVAAAPKKREEKPQEIHQEPVPVVLKEESPQRPALSPKEITVIQERLDLLEKRISTLDEKKPEYTEERVALEEKKFFLKHDTSSEATSKKELTEKENQLKEVEELLNKKMFGYVAPVISPVKEEEVRLKNAQEAVMLNSSPVTPVLEETLQKKEKSEDGISDEQLREASWTREAFIRHLQTDKGKWYENPSQNRDMVNECVIKIATLLSGKASSAIDMDDIQTARLFLFKKAPQNILKHPAFSYVESFYNYQNDQGHSGSDLNQSTKTKVVTQTSV